VDQIFVKVEMKTMCFALAPAMSIYTTSTAAEFRYAGSGLGMEKEARRYGTCASGMTNHVSNFRKCAFQYF